MIFRRISYRIAWQFTGFVFVLFMINGVAFFAADIQNAQRMSGDRLARSSSFAIRNLSTWPDIHPEQLPSYMRDRIRITTLQGKTVYQGGFFTDVPFAASDERSAMTIQGDEYSILTIPLIRKGVTVGFVQVAEAERQPLYDLYLRAVIYFFVSILVSGLTFVVGLYFARRNLKPAEEMMQRLEQFTQDASHELRTPLAALRSSLDLALKTGKHAEGIASAKDDVMDITQLVDRLLELTSLDQLLLKKLSFDCSGLVRESIDRQKALALEKGITLTGVIEESVKCAGDTSLFRQMLMSLIANAIKFTPTGGVVTVTLRRNMLTVADTGIGISPDDQIHIFDRFYQADSSRAHGGYGLGLALVKRICDLHGWTIHCTSEMGKGTTFTVLIRS